MMLIANFLLEMQYSLSVLLWFQPNRLSQCIPFESTRFDCLRRAVNLELKKAIKFYLHFAVILKMSQSQLPHMPTSFIFHALKTTPPYSTCAKCILHNCNELSWHRKKGIQADIMLDAHVCSTMKSNACGYLEFSSSRKFKLHWIVMQMEDNLCCWTPHLLINLP